MQCDSIYCLNALLADILTSILSVSNMSYDKNACDSERSPVLINRLSFSSFPVFFEVNVILLFKNRFYFNLNTAMLWAKLQGYTLANNEEAAL